MRPVGTFRTSLRELEARLAVPLPARVRILRELESDLEGLQARLVDHGIPSDEARALAEAALLPDAGTARELSQVHGTLYGRLTRGVEEARLRLIERGALAVAAGVVVVGITVALFRSGLLAGPSLQLVLVLGAGLVLLAETARLGFDLWVRGRHEETAPGLDRILVLAAGVLVLGALGALLGLHDLAVLVSLEPDRTGELVLSWLSRTCTVLAVALLLALAGGLAWLCMTQWLAWAGHVRRELLGLEPSHPLRGANHHEHHMG